MRGHKRSQFLAMFAIKPGLLASIRDLLLFFANFISNMKEFERRCTKKYTIEKYYKSVMNLSC